MKRALLILPLLMASVAARQDASKARVYVSDSPPWEQSGAFANADGRVAGFSSGGARPQTAELIRTLGERCPQVTVTIKREAAHYILLFDREGGKGVVRRDNKFALFRRDGDSVGSGSTRTLGNAVKDACAALLTRESLSYLDYFAGGVPAGAILFSQVESLRDAVRAQGEPAEISETIVEACLIGLVAYFEAFTKNHFASLINICPTLLENLKAKDRPLSVDALDIAIDPLSHSRLGVLVAERYDFGTARETMVSTKAALVGLMLDLGIQPSPEVQKAVDALEWKL